MKKLLSIIFIFTFFFISCKNDNDTDPINLSLKDVIVGSWKHGVFDKNGGLYPPDGYYIFKKDGTFENKKELNANDEWDDHGTWEVIDNNLLLKYDEGGESNINITIISNVYLLFKGKSYMVRVK